MPAPKFNCPHCGAPVDPERSGGVCAACALGDALDNVGERFDVDFAPCSYTVLRLHKVGSKPQQPPVVERTEGSYFVMTDSRKLLNMVSFDFLGFGQTGQLKAAARAALEHYGCGSCGPCKGCATGQAKDDEAASA